MFGYLNRLRLKQYLLSHRKHVKRRIGACEAKRQFSSGKFTKLGDLYARLGLTADVSQNDIKKAYYQLSLEHHPDKNDGCSISSEKFRKITEAYEILGNVTSRAQYDRDTPYGKTQRRRTMYSAGATEASFSEKDEELAEKIRIFRQNMRKRAKRPSYEYEDFTYRRENTFDFDAWYRAHFEDDFAKKVRNERVSEYARAYQRQMERIARGERLRPPRPYSKLDEKTLSDIEIQMEEMERKEFQNDVAHFFMFLTIFIVTFIMIACIIEQNTEKTPWQDPYVLKKEKEKEEEEKNKAIV